MEKIKTPLKISINPDNPPGDINSVLEEIFWKEPGMAGRAIDFLRFVKEWEFSTSPYLASGWRKYCAKAGITQSKYHSMLKRLKKAGMIEKTYDPNSKEHTIRLSGKFSSALKDMSDAWERFRRQ